MAVLPFSLSGSATSQNKNKPNDFVFKGKTEHRYAPLQSLPLQWCLSSWQVDDIILTFKFFTRAALSVAMMLDIWSLFVNKKHIHVIRITPKTNSHALIIEPMLRPHSQF